MSRGVRTLLVLLIALTAAGVASYAVYRAIQQTPVRQVEAPGIPVVVAAKPLPLGALVGKGDVKVVSWPASSPLDGAIAKAEDVVGRGLLSAVARNEPITEGKLAPREAGAGLAATIPPGMRAVSVKVDEVIAVAGFTVPGSRVDVLVTVQDQGDSRTRTVVSNLQVLAAGTRYDQQQSKDGKPIPASVVTLLATPEDAERIALSSVGGRVMLALRNPMDTAPTTTAGVRLASLAGPPGSPPVEKAVQARRPARAVAPAPSTPPQSLYTVEVIRAAKRTEEVVR